MKKNCSFCTGVLSQGRKLVTHKDYRHCFYYQMVGRLPPHCSLVFTGPGMMTLRMVLQFSELEILIAWALGLRVFWYFNSFIFLLNFSFALESLTGAASGFVHIDIFIISTLAISSNHLKYKSLHPLKSVCVCVCVCVCVIFNNKTKQFDYKTGRFHILHTYTNTSSKGKESSTEVYVTIPFDEFMQQKRY